jgi:hypothetical protein
MNRDKNLLKLSVALCILTTLSLQSNVTIMNGAHEVARIDSISFLGSDGLQRMPLIQEDDIMVYPGQTITQHDLPLSATSPITSLTLVFKGMTYHLSVTDTSTPSTIELTPDGLITRGPISIDRNQIDVRIDKQDDHRWGVRRL